MSLSSFVSFQSRFVTYLLTFPRNILMITVSWISTLGLYPFVPVDFLRMTLCSQNI